MKYTREKLEMLLRETEEREAAERDEFAAFLEEGGQKLWGEYPTVNPTIRTHILGILVVIEWCKNTLAVNINIGEWEELTEFYPGKEKLLMRIMRGIDYVKKKMED